MKVAFYVLMSLIGISCNTSSPPENALYHVELDNNSIEDFESQFVCTIDYAQLPDADKFYRLFRKLCQDPPELAAGSSYYRISLQVKGEELESVIIDLATDDKEGMALLDMIEKACQ